ncbi:MAG: hypothetical protein QOI09_1082, partial [Chloroflexota bacterium]|nr:hypothetical protein [Chloroflexota bacterium]
ALVTELGPAVAPSQDGANVHP